MVHIIATIYRPIVHPRARAPIPHHARKASAVGVDLALIVKDIDELQSMALTALEIVRVVRRRDLDRARAESHVNEL